MNSETNACPFCGGSVHRGYVISNGARLLFSLSKRKFEYSADDAGEVMLDRHRLLGCFVSASHCANCKKVIIDYE